MTTLFTVAGLCIAILALALLYGRSRKREAETAERFKQSERARDDMWRAKVARERLNADPDELKRVRDKYTRERLL